MDKTWSCIVVLLCACHMASLVANDCIYKECQCYETVINCADSGLTAIPDNTSALTTGYLTLSIDGNLITEIPAGKLPPGLTELYLVYNPITTIDDNALDQQSNSLQSMYFINARFIRIPNAFLHLNALNILSIINTNILDWNDVAMAKIGQTLQQLTLDNVGLQTWPDWLKYFHNLTELTISDNFITSIPDNGFEPFSNSLVTLTLANNSFTSVPKALLTLRNLTNLDLHSNKISNITWLPQSSTLYGLFLHNNRLSDSVHISNVMRAYANSLVSLSILYNQLTNIPDLSFLAMDSYFDFSNNHIADPNSGILNTNVNGLDLSFNILPFIPTIFKRLKSLISMYMDHNIVKVIQRESIPTWITNMDISYNLISELSETSFPENSALSELILDFNPIVTVSNIAFKPLGSLSRLSLQNTRITRLPLSLVYLTRITYIDLNNNPDLVCTCLEKSLKDKVAVFIDPNGKCGDITIYDFLATLGPLCP